MHGIEKTRKPDPRSLWRVIKGGVFFAYLAISILFLNLLQCLSLIVLPFSASLFYKINESFALFWWGSIVLLMEYGQGIQPHFYGDPLPLARNAIVIANHQGLTDIPALFCLAIRQKRLGALKWFVKDPFKYLPGPGWGMLFLNNIFVKRDWFKDQSLIEKSFSVLRTNNLPFWLMSFLEGTRRTPAKLERSQAYSRERGLPVLSHVLAPRTKGFVASVHALREQIDGIYDVTIGFPGKAPSMIELFIGQCPNIHFFVRRYPISTLPHDEEGLTRWVWERYAEKDQRMAYFARHESFPS